MSKVKTKQKNDPYDEIGWSTRILTICSLTSGTLQEHTYLDLLQNTDILHMNAVSG
jgi:hypothetical protein